MVNRGRASISRLQREFANKDTRHDERLLITFSTGLCYVAREKTKRR